MNQWVPLLRRGVALFGGGPSPAHTPRRPLAGRAAGDVAVPPGWLRLTAEDDATLSVLTEMGPRGLIPTQGYAQWTEVDVPRQVAFTQFAGYKPAGFDCELVFDGLQHDRPVTAAVRVLEALAGRGSLATPGEPPKVLLDTVRERYPGRYVVADLQHSLDPDEVVLANNGDLLLATITVTLLQFVDDERLEDRAHAISLQLRARNKSKGANRDYIVKEGETLVSIARDKLGDPGKWTVLSEINGIRDPRAVRRGAVIKLP